MADPRYNWLKDLSRGFKRHRTGRSGWIIELMRERLRVVSTELPPRPDEKPGALPKRRAVTLETVPGPSTSAAALAEACALFDAVMAGTWRWPNPNNSLAIGDPLRLSKQELVKLTGRLKTALVGEKIGLSTWERTYWPYLKQLHDVASQQIWLDDSALLAAVLKKWVPNGRARQMAHDRCRRLWKLAGWDWPSELLQMRGNGKAAASPDGARAFTDTEIQELRDRIQKSNLQANDLVAWDCLTVFGLRPAELKGLELSTSDGLLVAHVNHVKRSSKGSSGARRAPAVPPKDWTADCFDLLDRFHLHGLPSGMVAARSPGAALTQQLRRLQGQFDNKLDKELSSYGLRHAYALRLAQQLGLHVREAAELMGHSPAVHLSTYGRRLDTPKLLAKVQERLAKSMNHD